MVDQFNERHQLGMKILKKALAEIQDGEPYRLALDRLDPQDETRIEVLRHLANPGLAWIALGLINRITPEAFVNLRYVEFTDEFLTVRLEKIDLAEEKIDQIDIKHALELIAAAFLQSGDVAPPWTEFTATLEKMAAQEHSQLAEPKRLQRTLQALQQMNLLTIMEWKTPPKSLLSTEQRVELNFTTFWHRYIAETLFRSATAEGQKVRQALSAAAEWLDKAKSQYMREGVWEFFLLLLDREIPPRVLEAGKTRLSKFATHLWRSALQEPDWPAAAVWFAGPKASHEEVHRFLLRQMPDRQSEPFPQRLLFSLMYFVDQCDSIAGPARLAALQPLHMAIKAANLSEYFRFIAERILNQGYDNTLLVKKMWRLSGCESMPIAGQWARTTIADPLAHTAVACMVRNTDGDEIQLLATLYDFLEGCNPFADRHYEDSTHTAPAKDEMETDDQTEPGSVSAGERDDSWQRRYFREWVLHHFCAAIIAQHGAETYQLLQEQGWYKSGERIHHRIRHEMEREASFTFGWWFRRNRYNGKRYKSYLDLVDELSRSPKETERIRSFYLILHTVPKTMRVRTYMDQNFLPILKDLLTDTAIAKHLERNSDFVEFNLNE